MVATTVNNVRGHDALTSVRDFVAEHGTPEQQERLTRIMGGAVPSPRLATEFATYQTEALNIAFEMIADLKAANQPRRRGRPRKEG